MLLIAGTVLFQGFQCASTEMTTAKVALQNKDYQKAEQFLQKELAKNDINEEAWLFLIQIQLQYLHKPIDAIDNLQKCQGKIKDPEYLKRIPTMKYMAWTTCYDIAIKSIQEYIDQPEGAKDKKLIDNSLTHINKAIEIAPKQAKLFYLKGFIYERAEKKPEAMGSYKEFAKLYDGEIKLAKKGLKIGMNRQDAIKHLGAPNYTVGRRYTPQSDSLIIDQFLVDYKRTYVFSREQKDKSFSVFGWRFDPPKEWTAEEKENPDAIILDPFNSMTDYYYNTKQYDEALENVKTIIEFDPGNINANAYLVELYEIKGDPERALESISSLVTKEPTNKFYRAQYGDMLYKLEKYDEAIVQYEKAMEIDTNFYDVSRNLGSAYKNKAVEIQRKQIDRSENDPKYKPQKAEYEPFLVKSEKAFLTAIENSKYANDSDVLAELVNINEVLEKKEEFAKYLAKLEAIESIVPKEKLELYYLNLIKIYDRHGRVKDRDAVQAKLKSIEE